MRPSVVRRRTSSACSMPARFQSSSNQAPLEFEKETMLCWPREKKSKRSNTTRSRNSDVYMIVSGAWHINFLQHNFVHTYICISQLPSPAAAELMDRTFGHLHTYTPTPRQPFSRCSLVLLTQPSTHSSSFHRMATPQHNTT